MYTGENLYYFGTTGELDSSVMENAGVKATESWYKENKQYDYQKATFQKGTGHFTQVVWQSTAALGVAVATYKDGDWNKVVVVANYSPGGNVQGLFVQNVPLPSS